VIRRVVTTLTVIACVAAACAEEAATPAVTVTVTVTAPPSGDIDLEEIPDAAMRFWSTETQPERVAVTNRIIDAFSEQTGIEVIRVYVSEDALPETIEAAAAEGRLPEVVFHPIDFTIGWARAGYLDVEAADAVIDELGRDTFAPGALDLATVDGYSAAIPSDGWGQLVVYRRDLFDAAGLAVPDTYEAIEAAAAALTDPATGRAGIALATDPDAVFTQQTFEHFALANGCHLVDVAGNVQVGSSNCVEAIEVYARLAAEYGPGGIQDAASTRAAYFAGEAAMLVWSPFILDEMAGLRDDALPDCSECESDPAFLATHSGFVPSFRGPHGSPVQYGQISYMGIGAGSNVQAAQAFLTYWFNEGYLAWLSTSAEGKFPMRRGTPENPEAFIDGWQGLETGVDRTAALRDLYGEGTIDLLIAGSASFDRWGFSQGHGDLVSAMYSELYVPRALGGALDGSLTPQEAADEIAQFAELEMERARMP
jgi:multiple sugar transport system substrate-binding protein